MKKFLAVILSCVILGIVLAGCTETADHGDWKYIEDKGTLIVGITDYAPMNYIGEGSSEWIGFDTEFALAIGEKLGVEVQFQEITEWSAIISEINAKNVDAIWNGMTVNEKREENMHLSTHYMKNRQVFVTTAEKVESYKTADDLASAVIVAENGSTGSEVIKEDEFFAQAKAVEVDKQITAMMEIKAGTADGAVLDYLMAAYLINTGTDFSGLAISQYKTFADEEYAIAFRKNSPETVKKVNDAIAEMKLNGELQAIADKYGLGDLLIK